MVDEIQIYKNQISRECICKSTNIRKRQNLMNQSIEMDTDDDEFNNSNQFLGYMPYHNIYENNRHIQKIKTIKNLNNNMETLKNNGNCPYCPRTGFKGAHGVNIHIGHMHKCKQCYNLEHLCKCNKIKYIPYY